MLRWNRVILTHERPARSNVHQMVMSTLSATHKSQMTEPINAGWEANDVVAFNSFILVIVGSFEMVV